MNLENMQNRMFYLTSRNAKTVRLYDFRFQNYGSNSGFNVFGDLDLDLWPMFYFSHALGMVYWNLHAQFHKTHTHTEGHSNGGL